jgi:hypothetical protein
MRLTLGNDLIYNSVQFHCGGETIAFASHIKGKEKKGKGIRKKSRKSVCNF